MAAGALYYEDVEIGDGVGPVRRTITSEQVREFVGMWAHSRDTGRFTESGKAREHGQTAPIVPGAMSMAAVSQLLAGWSPTVTLRKVDVIFRQMVRHGAPLDVGGVVIDKRVADGGPQIECDVFIDEVDGGRLVMGHAVITLPMRGADTVGFRY